MKRLNLRDVPDDVYDALASAAEADHRSLNAFVVERLREIADVVTLAEYLSSYVPPSSTGVTLEDAIEAVRAVRDAS